MLGTLMPDDTDCISNDSVKLKPFTDVNHPRSNLNSSSRKFYVPLDLNCIHKPQSNNLKNKCVWPSTPYYIPRNLNNQVVSNMNPIKSHSTPHTLYPNIPVKPQELLTDRLRLKIQLKHLTTLFNSIHAFIDELVKVEETVFFRKRYCHINILVIITS